MEAFYSLTNFFSAMVAFDCMFDTMSRGSFVVFRPDEDEIRVSYIKLLMWFGMPIVAAIGTFCTWYAIMNRNSEMRKDKDMQTKLYTKFLATLIIILFLIHPILTQYFVQMFNCKVYDGDSRMEMDLQVICGEGLHQTFAYFVAFPGFLLWGLCVPALIYFLMAKEQRNLGTKDVQD